ncbi:MAG: hypothetical protein HY303_18520, partial [Candidatus Wallbacteria bacterium]|nr:hypothetical protein [Candidatus Wallbacteria bacterium]
MIRARTLATAILGALVLTVAAALPVAADDFQLFDNGSGTMQVAVGSSTVFILKNNGNIWQYRMGQFNRIDDGVGTKQIDTDGDTLYVLKNNGNVWQYNGFRFTQVDDGTGSQMIASSSGKC